LLNVPGTQPSDNQVKSVDFSIERAMPGDRV
jgi:hypothetical protein